MFRTDRDALAQQVEDLRREGAELRAQNDAMRSDLLARRQQVPVPVRKVNASVYTPGPSRLTPGELVALTRHEVTPFPPWAAVLLHFATFGIWSLVHFSRLHDQLPHAERDDPSAARSIGFSFIPYFSIYWIVFNTIRVADRVNLQFRLRGLPDAVPRGLLVAAGVSSAIPHTYAVLGYPLLWPFAVYYLQRAANALAALPRAGADAAAGVETWASRARVPLVRDLPGPEDMVALEAEIEADEALRPRSLVR
jgi:hypothetical protein